MAIYDEQAPFTKEQADYLATNYVKKTIVRSGQNVARWVEHENNLAASNFLRRLTLEGGAIVCSEACSERELSYAKKEGRFFVDENNYGYVLKLEKWRSLAERYADHVLDLPEESQVTPEEYLIAYTNAN
jgi:hypothetical protein